jgi:hypothetical protein
LVVEPPLATALVAAAGAHYFAVPVTGGLNHRARR